MKTKQHTKRVFVTGTDTDIGKTVVSIGLCLQGSCHYWKPIQAGTMPHTDSEAVQKFIPASYICPSAYTLQLPASPNQASQREGIVIDKQKIVSQLHSFKNIKNLVIEGAGGLLVPMNDREYISDLIPACKAAALLVARSGLGTLNHTLLSLAHLRAKKIPVLGVIMVGDKHAANKKDIETLGQVPVLLELPLLNPLSIQNLKNHFKPLASIFRC